ncbi:twin-arginine translocase subunit TatC [Phaeacidiphilus oryzae]|uniref:twin-arginine translocase subunit TatC n=1 Tax=Phaeacidiphilus oryzae TaxID=348818 RepID=UPI000AA5459D|nr:twin-arginine translocase subunit TatC [Phaeacidiphilus oryzae]
MSSDTQSEARGRRAPRPKPPKNDEGRMPLADHLRELRSRIVKSLLAIVLTTIVGLIFHSWALHQMTGPVCDIKSIHGLGRPSPGCPNGLLAVTGPLGGISLSFKVSLMIGLVLASPIWSFQLWAFVAPGLYKKEKRYGLGFAGAAVPLFLCGAGIAFWIFPKAIDILMSFVPAGMSSLIEGDQFLDFFIRMIVVFGLSFELPLLLVALNFVGIVTAERLRGWWRPIVFLIFVFAAIATPTGDPVTMCVMAVPICVLFFIALGVATLHDRRKLRRRAEDPDYGLGDDEASQLDLTPSVISEPVAAQPLDHTPEQVTASELPSLPAARDGGGEGDAMDDIT